MKFNKENIRELLIDSLHSDSYAKSFFKNNGNESELLNILLEFVIDDYSNDARMEASYWISNFDTTLLKNVEKELLDLQDDELDSIAYNISIALGRIKSKEGLKFLIEKRIAPEMYWEAEILKYYLSDNK